MIRVNAKAAAMVCAVGLGVSTASVASAGTGAGVGRSTVTTSAGHRVAAVHVIAAKHIGKRVVELTISTPAFTTPTKVDVDLPVGYHAHKHRRWPVTYFLAGIMNTYASFNHVVDGLKLTRHYRSIAVSPNGDSGYWSDWYNDGAFGPPEYETFVIDQLIPLIDGRFRTIAKRSERAIAGVSMGGYGAMMLAARHPDLFAEAASLSGAVNNTPAALAAALAVSPTFQGAPPNSIYGPQATQAIRWHGHNPTDLAANLRGLDLQVRTANGVPDPAIGENALSADSASCVIEAGVYGASVDFHQALDRLHVRHLWHDYGPGCHTVPNFTREIAATLKVFSGQFAHPPHRPASFGYASIEPIFHVWGWKVRADSRRALEFLDLRKVGAHRMTLIGSGMTTVTSPPRFRRARRVRLTGATTATAVADSRGRITFTVDLGPADTQQQDTAGATTVRTRRTVRFHPQRVA